MSQHYCIEAVIDAWDVAATGATPIAIVRARPGLLRLTAIGDTCRVWPGRSAWSSADEGLAVCRDCSVLVRVPDGVDRVFCYVPAGVVLNCAQVRVG